MPRVKRCRTAVLAAAALLLAPAGAAAKSTAVVALGDSAMSGESAGSYEPGTDRPGNYCHRSRAALIHRTAIPNVDVTLNLACSGASTRNLLIGGAPRNGEPPQSEQLRAVAAAYDVRMVIVEVGANDDPQFADVAAECVGRYIVRLGSCRTGLAAAWPGRVSAMAPKVAEALRDVRTVMQQADPDGGWQLVLASYWSPVPAPPIRYSGYLAKLVHGCPLYAADMSWAHGVAVPQLNAALRGVAAVQNWRFLDLSRSMDGREICAAGIGHREEWVTGLKYDPWSSSWFSFDAVRQSLHANAAGHAQLGACVTEFYAAAAREGRCLRGPDGRLHAVT